MWSPTGAANICSPCTWVAEGKALLCMHIRGVTLRGDQTLCMKKVNSINGDQRNLSALTDLSTMASVSNIKWTVHSQSINIAVVPLSAPHHYCHLFISFASTVALPLNCSALSTVWQSTEQQSRVLALCKWEMIDSMPWCSHLFLLRSCFLSGRLLIFP